MALTSRVRDYLDAHGIHYTLLPHGTAYTAQEVAANVHVPGKEVAKTVVFEAGNRFGMAVLPAHHHVDLDALSRVVGAKVRLAAEDEFKGLFPECEPGAMPPFGHLYGLPVWVAEPLTKDREIVFNAGTHTEALRTSYQEFATLETPQVADFSRLAKPGHRQLDI